MSQYFLDTARREPRPPAKVNDIGRGGEEYATGIKPGRHWFGWKGWEWTLKREPVLPIVVELFLDADWIVRSQIKREFLAQVRFDDNSENVCRSVFCHLVDPHV